VNIPPLSFLARAKSSCSKEIKLVSQQRILGSAIAFSQNQKLTTRALEDDKSNKNLTKYYSRN